MITDTAGRAHFVIDQHVHVGMRPARSTTASSSYLPDELLANMDANGVDMVVGFPKANPHTDYRVENERIIAAMKQHPTRIIGFARINPYFGAKAVADVHDYAAKGALGLKIHPLRDFSGNRVNDPELMFPIVEAAQAENLLLLVHSGNSWNCAPTLIADLARNFPKANFVIAHSAGFEGIRRRLSLGASRIICISTPPPTAIPTSPPMWSEPSAPNGSSMVRITRPYRSGSSSARS